MTSRNTWKKRGTRIMVSCKDGILYYRACMKCGAPIAADGGMYTATRYADTDDGPVCEECFDEWARDWFEENCQTDRVSYGEDIYYQDDSGRF